MTRILAASLTALPTISAALFILDALRQLT